MSILRKLGEVFGGLIFSFSLGLLIVFIALANFTQHSNLQTIITEVVKNQLSNQTNDIYSVGKQQCNNKVILDCTTGAFVNTNSSDATFCLSSLNINISCEIIKNSQPSDLTNTIAETIFNQTYFKKYDCGFLECVSSFILPQNYSTAQSQQFQVILSEKANKFFTTTQIYLIIGTILGLVLLAVSISVWYNILKTVGISLIFIGIIYFLIPFAKSMVSNLPQLSQQREFSSIVDSLFNPILYLLEIALILGVVLTAAGYIFSFLLHHKETKEIQKKSANIV